MILWGIVTACLGAAKNAATLIALRLLLGCFEAFYQASVLYGSMWYTREELALRSGTSFSVGGFAGSFTGLIAVRFPLRVCNRIF